MSTTSTSGTRMAAGPILTAGALAGVIAGVANLVIFLIGKAVKVPFVVNQAGTKTDVIFIQPLLASFIAVFLGAVLLWLLSGRANAVTLWSRTAIVVVVLYSVVALGLATSIATGLTLTLMHFVALAVAWVRLRPAAARP